MSVGRRIRDARVAAGLSVKDLARECGVSRSAVAMYENDLRVPTDKIKRKLAEILNRGIEELFF